MVLNRRQRSKLGGLVGDKRSDDCLLSEELKVVLLQGTRVVVLRRRRSNLKRDSRWLAVVRAWGDDYFPSTKRDVSPTNVAKIIIATIVRRGEGGRRRKVETRKSSRGRGETMEATNSWRT